MASVRPCWLLPDHVAKLEKQSAALEHTELAAMQPMVATTGPAYYPLADRTSAWYGDTYPGVDMGGVDKLLWHTTETGGLPGYGGGASAPTLTFSPKTLKWWQHFPLYRSARALRDPDYTLVRENRDRVIQVEIIATSDRTISKRYGYLHIEDLSDAALQELGLLYRFLHDHYGVPYQSALVWLPYPESYGNSAARMTGPEFDAFRGQCAHQHASGNTHGDCNPNIGKILAYAQPTSPPPEDDLPTPVEVWELKRYAEYVDENGNQVRDTRTMADILFAAHAAAVKAERQAEENAAVLARIEQKLAAL